MDQKNTLHGLIEEHDQDGFLLSQVHYLNGVKQSSKLFYYKSNTPQMECHYKDGHIPHGTWTLYHKNGQIKALDIWDDGILKERTDFYSNGTPNKTHFYDNEELTKIKVFEPENRSLIIHYKDNQALHIEHFIDNTLTAIQDVQNNILTYYHPDGQTPHTTITKKNNLCLIETFNKNGGMLTTGHYDMFGQETGIHREFNKNGQLCHIYEYKNAHNQHKHDEQVSFVRHIFTQN
jgi:antitoxin component YwqK of YwqJK toxin-antitoxin module